MQIFDAPTWIYLLFVCLLILGIKSIDAKTVSLPRLFLLPAIFVMWNFIWLFSRPEGKYSFFALWFVGLIFGSVIGWQTVRSWNIQANRQKKTITLPGSSSTLILILIIFSVRFYFGHTEATTPNLSNTFLDIDACISGLLTGVFVGRVLELYHKYTRARG